MKGEPVPQEHHILRYVGGRNVDNDMEGIPVILGGGFIARPDDDNRPSCNWIEYFDGSLDEQVGQIRNAARINYGAKARLARLGVGQVIGEVAAHTMDNREISVIHDPLDPEGDWIADPSHALMTNIPGEDDPEGELVGDLIANCVLESFPARAP